MHPEYLNFELVCYYAAHSIIEEKQKQNIHVELVVVNTS